MIRKKNLQGFVATIAIAHLVLFSNANDVLGDYDCSMTNVATIFSNFGTDQNGEMTYADGSDVDFPPFELGRALPIAEQSDPSHPKLFTRWAMPFVPTRSGYAKYIYLAIVNSDERPAGEEGPGYGQSNNDDYFFAIHEDKQDNEQHVSLNQPTDDYDGLLYRWSEDGVDLPIPTCPLCEHPCTCVSLETLVPPHKVCNYHILPDDPYPSETYYLEAGHRYWLVVVKTNFDDVVANGIQDGIGDGHNVGRWYRNNQSDIGAGPGNTSPEVGALYSEILNEHWATWSPWTAAPAGPIAAFRIDATGVSSDLCEDAARLPNVSPDVGTCDSDDPTQFTSMCWYRGFNLTGMQYPENGFPLNINLWQPFGPGDYPPKHLDAELSSSPLVSQEVRHFTGPVPYRERPTHNDLVDLITGQPLLQATDFELPFGSATFRHIRTYSENFSDFPLQIAGGPGLTVGYPAQGSRWDWNGLMWSMSENPILLVDAEYRDAAGNALTFPNVKCCYFIPDAHHSIPFLYDGNLGGYTAPPWFDAVMLQDSPTQFSIWLNRKTIKYTFQVHTEDIWTKDGVNVHEPFVPADPNIPESVPSGGLGIPYYALITQIQDRYGNRMEYEYCKQRQWDCDSLEWPDGWENHSVCHECCQNCTEKGQLRTIKLRTADNTVAWTLVYTHREFSTNDISSEYLFPQHALHTIHVFKGEVDVPAEYGCLTVGWEQFRNAQTLDEIDAINHPAIEAISQLHPWLIESRYLYSENGALEQDIPFPFSCPATHLLRNAAASSSNALQYHSTQYYRNTYGGHLMKVTTTKRRFEEGQEILDKNYTLYRDAERLLHRTENWGVVLKSIYDNETIQSILDNIQRTEQGDRNVNRIFEKSDDDEVTVKDPVTQKDIHKKLADLADVFMTDYAGDVHTSNGVPNVPLEELVSFCGCDAQRTCFAGVNRRSFLKDQRHNSPQNGTYNYYYLLQYPSSIDTANDPYDYWPFSPPVASIYDVTHHYPYRLYDPVYFGSSLVLPSLRDPMYITIIDGSEEVKSPDGSPTLVTQKKMRRVVEMNAAGFVLNDRTWEYKNGELQIEQQLGSAQRYKYDCKGRIIQKRTKGWSAAEAGSEDENTEGLIYVYEYEDPCCTWNAEEDQCDCEENLSCATALTRPGELIAQGVMKGKGNASSQVHWLKSFVRDVPNHPELVTAEVAFPNDTATLPTSYDPSSNAYEITSYQYEFDTNTENSENPPIHAKTIIGPKTLRGANDSTGHHAIQKSVFNVNGNLVWQGMGSLPTPNDFDSADEFYINFNHYDEIGRPLLQISDVDTAANLPEIATELPLPDGWVHKSPSEALPLHLKTEYEYEAFGLTEVRFPNHRLTRIKQVSTSEGVQQWIFKDLVCSRTPSGEEDPGGWRTLSPVQITVTDAGRLVKQMEVVIKGEMDLPDGRNYEANPTNQILISSMTPTYDKNGRIVGVKRVGGSGGSNAPTISAEVTYDASGEIARQRAPDGTLTRNIYDELGRLSRVYRGTDDTHEFWATAVVCQENEDPEETGCTPEEQFTANMVLVEKHYYGTGVRNADLPIAIRTFNDVAINPYYEIAGPNDPPVDPNNEDGIGHLTWLDYDWRMRQVYARNSKITNETEPSSSPVGNEGDPISRSLTWCDNLGRKRFSATYGAQEPPASVDPRLRAAGQETPTATEILSQSVKPVSLTETIYNKLGQPEEVRRYMMDGPTSYTSTFTYYGFHGKPIEVRAANAPVMKYDYDAKARPVRNRTIVGDVEIARNETFYGDSAESNCSCDTEQAILTVSWERRPDAQENDLNETNSVRTYTHIWYDLAGRVIATASYGTNNPNRTFESGTAPAYNPAIPPVNQADDEDGQPIVTGINPSALGSAAGYATVTGYVYDKAGRQCAVFHPNGAATRTDYDDLGRTLLVTEAGGTDIHNATTTQQTAYQYDDKGRLSKMAGLKVPVDSYDEINWTPTAAGDIEVTEFIYGANIVDHAGTSQSRNQGLISEVHFPDSTTGAPSAMADLTYTYYFDSSVASRRDANGNVFTYTYDELGRLTHIGVNDQGWYTHEAQLEAKNLPTHRISSIDLQYTVDGLISKATARGTTDEGPDTIIGANEFGYDSYRNLMWERQAHRSLITGLTPEIHYTWDFSPQSAGNYNRLVGMVYPPKDVNSPPRRILTYNYGATSGSLDSALGRITGISDYNAGQLSSYSYAGMSRRISFALGNGIEQSFASGGAYTGLDHFGRIKDLNYTFDGQTVHRYQYGYDLAGNRTYARVTQADEQVGQSTLSHDNDRSYFFEYDGLSRLLRATRGTLDSNNASITSGSGNPTPQSIDWHLDRLGNWSRPAGPGGTNNPTTGSVIWKEGSTVTRQVHHVVDERNEIDTLREWQGENTPTDTSFIYDAGGNLIYDGQLVYQYDAFNRLLQVNLPGNVAFDAAGRIVSGELGDMLGRYVYDGLGRLIAKETPLTIGNTSLQVKDFYYDGVRRIQERIYRPNLFGFELAQGFTQTQEPGIEEVVVEPTQNDEAIAGMEEFSGGELGEGEGQSQLPPQNITSLPPPTNIPFPPQTRGRQWIDREYVYGPGYVDEFIAQFDKDDAALYLLQDANYNVVALLCGTADPGCESGGGPGHLVLEQYTYEPYGTLADIDRFDDQSNGQPGHAVNRIGHQGLFFDRFDGGLNEPTLTTSALGLYYNRNRMYSPTLGRFMQRDPNETALPVVTAMAMNGQALDSILGGLDASGVFTDGMNLYLYAGANPISRNDPSGLFDPFEDTDDVIAEMGAEKAAWAQAAFDFGMGVMRGAATFALEASITAVCPPCGMYFGGKGIYSNLQDMMANGLTWGNGFSLIGNVAGFRAGLKAFGKFRQEFGALRASYGTRGSGLGGIVRTLRAFTFSNFRHNLMVHTGIDPGSAVHAHHMLPIAYEHNFKAVGINIHEPKWGAWWEMKDHLSNAFRYNKAWKEFFMAGDRTPSEIADFAKQLAAQHGLVTNF